MPEQSDNAIISPLELKIPFYPSGNGPTVQNVVSLSNSIINYTGSNDSDLPYLYEEGNASVTYSNETFEFPSFPIYMQVVYSCCCALTFVVGVIGNLLVPMVVYKDRELTNSSTGAFIVNLALADILVLLVCNPAVVVELFSPPQIWVLPAPMCKLVPFIEVMVENASVLTILAISFERHHVICHPLRAATACTKTRAALICALVWPVAAAMSCPIIVGTEWDMAKYMGTQKLVPVCYTRVDTIWPSIYMLFLNLGLFFLPFVVLMILYGRIVRQLLLDDKYLCPQKSNSNFQARKQVVVMLGTVVASFFVCLLPYHVFSLWHIVASNIHVISGELYFNIMFVSRSMIYVNSAVNPILYNLTSSRFRGSLSRLMGFRKHQLSVSRTSSFHPGMTLQMGVTMPLVSAMTHTLERSSLHRERNEKYNLVVNRFHSLKVFKNTQTSPLKSGPPSSAGSSPYFSHKTNSSLTISTQLNSPCPTRASYSHQSLPNRKGFFSAKGNSSGNSSQSVVCRFNENAGSFSKKSPFLGRSATMLTSPSHLSDQSPYSSRRERRNQCEIPTCCHSSLYNINHEESLITPQGTVRFKNVVENESYV